jgi:hypothetical protein
LFSQRTFAAFVAICLRRSAVNFLALALPPFNPPNRPNITAAGFLPSAVALAYNSSIVTSSTIDLASWFTSGDSFLDSSSIILFYIGKKPLSNEIL